MASSNNPVVDAIKSQEVVTSGELISRLRDRGFTDEAARQAIVRSAKAGQIWRSDSLKLPRNERLFSTRAFRNHSEFFDEVGKKLAGTNRDGLAGFLRALGQQEVIHKINAMRLLAVAPAMTNRQREFNKRVYERELGGLKELGVEVVHGGMPGECLVSPNRYRSDDVDTLARAASQRLREETVLARVLTERLRQQNVLGWNQVNLPDTSTPFVVFNDQVFTAFGFSYLTPLTRPRPDGSGFTPCPVLVDCYQSECNVSQVNSFVQRLARVSNRGRGKMPVLGIIAAKDFERTAWDTAKKNGLMSVNLRQMFGEPALEIMAQIEHLLSGMDPSNDFDEQKRSFEELTSAMKDLKENPIVATVRAIGFEIVAALFLRSAGHEGVELGRTVPWQKSYRDVDAYGVCGGNLRVMECKAYHRKKSITPSEVEKFFTETVPALKRYLREKGVQVEQCVAEIWTTGTKGKEAGDKLHKLKPPHGDKWRILRIEEMKKLLPPQIRKRSVELLNAIADVSHEQG